MEGIPLLSGAYQARSVIASSQRCVNLYVENNPQEIKSPFPTTHYQRPGKALRWTPPGQGAGRGLYCASNGDLYAVVNDTVYFINKAYNYNVIGNIAANNTPISMADNGVTGGNEIALVDGTTTGYQINMTNYAFFKIVDGAGVFTGADVVAYLETYFIFNTVPNTQNFIITEPNSLTFNVLDIASKSAYADNLITLGIRSKELWLLGNKSSTEPWYLSGALDFPFESIPSTFVPYGCAGKYSLIFADAALHWISINEQGRAIFLQSEGYAGKRISTFAIESMVQGFTTISDAIGQSFQIEGHTFVVWSFPTADVTLVYDKSNGQWSQWAYTDGNGRLHRDKGCFYAAAYNTVFVQDWATGQVYEVRNDVYDDNGSPVSYIRGFPVVQKELNRITHNTLRAYMDAGTETNPNAVEPVVLLTISDDGGKSWYQPLSAPLGNEGEYDNVVQFTRLGQARTRVYELKWSGSFKMSLNGVYVDPEEADS